MKWQWRLTASLGNFAPTSTCGSLRVSRMMNFVKFLSRGIGHHRGGPTFLALQRRAQWRLIARSTSRAKARTEKMDKKARARKEVENMESQRTPRARFQLGALQLGAQEKGGRVIPKVKGMELKKRRAKAKGSPRRGAAISAMELFIWPRAAAAMSDRWTDYWMG